MASLLQIKHHSNVARALRSQFTQSSRESWKETGQQFHTQHRDKRFTNAHATAAQYTRRQGESGTEGAATFRKSYTGRKLARYGHTRPLELTGETRRAVTLATIRSTSKGVKVAYPGARKFNFRGPTTTINMAAEFRRITSSEASTLAAFYAERLADHFKQGN